MVEIVEAAQPLTSAEGRAGHSVSPRAPASIAP
jgi:hypothetical protein